MHKLTIDFDNTYTYRVMSDSRSAYLGDDGLWVEHLTMRGRFYLVWRA